MRPSRPSMRRRPLIAIAVGSCLALVAGCAGSEPDGDAPTATPAGGPTQKRVIAFSPLSLGIPALQGLSIGLSSQAKSKGYEVLAQDPKFDPALQAQQLTGLISARRIDGAWVLPVKAQALRTVVAAAQKKGIALLLNGHPENYGLSGMQKGMSFTSIDYAAQGTALGEAMATCVNSKLGGKARLFFAVGAAGTTGKEEIDAAARTALQAGAPGATIVSEILAGAGRANSQGAISSALQGNPGVNAIMSTNDEGALAGLGAFAAAGKELPCVVNAGGGVENIVKVRSGEIQAVVAILFTQDLRESFAELDRLMQDPGATGVQRTVPIKTFTAAG